MRFRAKVRFRGEKNAECLIRAFFSDFNAESSITIKGAEANLNIIFEEPPMKIVDAIAHCEVEELVYSKGLDTAETVDNGEKLELEYKADEPEATIKAETVEIQEESQIEVTGKKHPTGEIKKVADNIPELKKFAEEAKSYKEFVNLVTNWLGFKERTHLFEEMVFAATNLEKIAWKSIEATLKDNQVEYNNWDKQWCVLNVSKKLKGYSATILPLIRAMVQYKESFEPEGQVTNFASEPMVESEEQEIVSTTESETEVLGSTAESEENETYSEEETVEEVSADETTEEDEYPSEEENPAEEIPEASISARRVKMKCMPEIDSFEEILGNLNEADSVQEKVRYILDAMGASTVSYSNEILKIAVVAVESDNMDIDAILAKTGIREDDRITARMAFAKLVNDFAVKHGSENKVKLMDFLSELRIIVIGGET